MKPQGKPVVPESFPGPGRMGVEVRCCDSQRERVCREGVLGGYWRKNRCFLGTHEGRVIPDSRRRGKQ